MDILYRYLSLISINIQAQQFAQSKYIFKSLFSIINNNYVDVVLIIYIDTLN